MKPHPRIRKAIHWSGAATLILLLTTTIASRFGVLYVVTPSNRMLTVGYGAVSLAHQSTWQPMIDRTHWRFARVPGANLRWLPAWSKDLRGWQLDIPFWLFASVLALPNLATLLFWIRARRRIRAHRCPACNYNLTGLPPTTPCPECGTL